MHSNQCTTPPSRRVIALLQIYVVNGRRAGRACNEVQLPWRGDDDRVALKPPVGSGRCRGQSQRFIRRGRAVVHIEVEL